MKIRVDDPQLKIAVKPEWVSYDITEFSPVNHERTITRNRKNGYKVYNENGVNIGILFMSDDPRWVRYECAEIMFYSKYKKEYGSWRVIQRNGQRMDWDVVVEKMSNNETLVIVTDARIRYV